MEGDARVLSVLFPRSQASFWRRPGTVGRRRSYNLRDETRKLGAGTPHGTGPNARRGASGISGARSTGYWASSANECF